MAGAPVLAKASEIRDILVCPRCRGELDGESADLRCAADQCGLSVESFPDLDQQPALIDFDASVIDRAGLIEGLGASYSERKQGFLSRGLRRLAFGRNRVAESYVVRVLDE